MTYAIRGVVFRQVPQTPALNKWARLAPVVDFVVLGTLLSSILANVFAALQVPENGNDIDVWTLT